MERIELIKEVIEGWNNRAGDITGRLIYLFQLSSKMEITEELIIRYYGYFCETFIPYLKELELIEEYELCNDLTDLIKLEKRNLVEINFSYDVLETLDIVYETVLEEFSKEAVEC
jgi:hypothetical protein